MVAAVEADKVTILLLKPVLHLACLAQQVVVAAVASETGQAPMRRVMAVVLVMQHLGEALLLALVALLAVQARRDRCCLLVVAVAVAVVDTAQVALALLVALEPLPVAAEAEAEVGLPQVALVAMAVTVKLLL